MTEVFRYNYDVSALQLARDFVALDSIGGKSYLFYPNHDYSYDLIVGDIDFNTMSWTDATRYTITTVTPSGSIRGYLALNVSHYHDADNITNPYGVAVYGSGENMPHLIDKGGVSIEIALLLAVIVAFLSLVCVRLFDNVSRR